ncbi:MAG: EamA family transporter [Clostridiales bacterium]|nr:EamA family transporter [Clostridiales bacterium]
MFVLNRSSSNAWSILSVLGALILWSSSFVAIKFAYETYPPITLAAVRFVVATLILGALTLLPKNRVRLEKKDIFTVVICGLTGIMMYAVLQNIAMQWTSASSATLIIASYPVITLLLETLIYKTKLNALKIVGILIAIVGVVILSYVRADARQQGELLGSLLLVAAGVVWAIYNFMTKKVVNRYPPVTLLFYTTLVGTIFMLPMALIERGQWQPPTLLSFSMMLFLGVFCSVIAFLLYNRGLKTMAASSVTSMLNLVPIFGVFFSYILLGEEVTLRKFIGGAIVILGVMLSIRRTRAEVALERAQLQTTAEQTQAQ